MFLTDSHQTFLDEGRFHGTICNTTAAERGSGGWC
jgi:hypothetical protein